MSIYKWVAKQRHEIFSSQGCEVTVLEFQGKGFSGDVMTIRGTCFAVNMGREESQESGETSARMRTGEVGEEMAGGVVCRVYSDGASFSESLFHQEMSSEIGRAVM